MNETNLHDSTPFGLLNLWSQGDIITRTVAIILLAMSITSWVVIMTRAWGLWKIKPHSAEVALFWQKHTWGDAMASFTGVELNPFYNIAKAADGVIQERISPPTLAPIKLEFLQDDWLERSLKLELDNSVSLLQKGLAFLASTGATAPFIGLFGTVWGIYHALMSIGASGSASIDQVAGPIGEALIMTALGLAVAIPAVLGYNALTRMNRELLAELKRFADDLHSYFGTQKVES